MKHSAFFGSIAICALSICCPSLASEDISKPTAIDPHKGFYIELGIGYRSRGKSDWSNKSLSASGTDFWHDSLATSSRSIINSTWRNGCWGADRLVMMQSVRWLVS